MELLNRFIDIADGWKLVTLVILVAAVLAIGVINALLKGQFKLSAVADILRKRVVPGIGGYYVMCLVATVNDSLKAAAIAAFVIVVAALTADVLAGLKELGVPFPLPETITKVLTESKEPKSQ